MGEAVGLTPVLQILLFSVNQNMICCVMQFSATVTQCKSHSFSIEAVAVFCIYFSGALYLYTQYFFSLLLKVMDVTHNRLNLQHIVSLLQQQAAPVSLTCWVIVAGQYGH